MPSLRTFIARVPNPLLHELLQRLKIELPSNALEEEPAGLADVIDEIISTMPPGTRGRFEGQIEKIDKLANEAGETAIDSVTLHENLRDLPSRHARVLWLLLNDPEGFKRAEEVFYSDARRFSPQWTKFGMEGGKTVDLTPEVVEKLIADLRIAFDTRNVEIDVFDRTRLQSTEDKDEPNGSLTNTDRVEDAARLVQITIYCEGRPNEDWAFIDGRLGTQLRFPVIEAAVTYEPETGVIECVGRQKEKRADVVRLVATTLLGASADFEPAPARAYDLTVLSQPLRFETDPDDGIESVDVTMMRLLPTDALGERLIIETLSECERDIWSMVGDRLGEQALRTDYFIGQARLVIRYKPKDGTRTRSLPITITHPYRSNIKERLEIERLVGTKYLQRWGLLAA